MRLKIEAYHSERIGPSGIPFQRSARPKTLSESTADQELMSRLQLYRHRARTADGQDIASLPGIEQPK
jgi:hypothetical protein